MLRPVLPNVRRHKGKRLYTEREEVLFELAAGLLRLSPDRKGQCYKFACEEVLKGFGDYLIGKAIGEDGSDIFHAIASSRTGRFYYDPTLDACFCSKLYEKFFGWRLALRMSLSEVRGFIRDHGQYPNPNCLPFPHCSERPPHLNTTRLLQ